MQYKKRGNVITQANTKCGTTKKTNPLANRQMTLMGKQSVPFVERNTIGLYTVLGLGTPNKYGPAQKLILSATCVEPQVPPAASNAKSLHIAHATARNNIGRQAINTTAKHLFELAYEIFWSSSIECCENSVPFTHVYQRSTYTILNEVRIHITKYV